LIRLAAAQAEGPGQYPNRGIFRVSLTIAIDFEFHFH